MKTYQKKGRKIKNIYLLLIEYILTMANISNCLPTCILRIPIPYHQ